MIYALLEPLIVGLVVLSAVGVAWRKWRPSRLRSGGCGSGCNSCSSAPHTGNGCSSPPAAGGPKALQTVAMPRSRRTSR